jgi:hypothetical protein
MVRTGFGARKDHAAGPIQHRIAYVEGFIFRREWLTDLMLDEAEVRTPGGNQQIGWRGSQVDDADAGLRLGLSDC